MGLQATNAGIDFQQRVSAFMMILMEFDIEISAVLQLNENDKIMTLSTCSDAAGTGRVVLHAKLIKKEVR